MLIEKAYAKVYGNYSALEGGWLEDALLDLTGCPTDTRQLANVDDHDDFWDELKSYDEQGFLLMSPSIELDDY